MIILSHPTGNQNSRNAVEAFYKANRLEKFYTTVCWDNQLKIAQFLPKNITTALCRREYKCVPNEKIRTYPYLELARLAANKFGAKCLTRHETGIFCVDSVYRHFDNYVAKYILKQENVSQVYCYEDGALESFKAAKQKNIETLYELPIGYWRAAKEILWEEAELKPDWASSILNTGNSSEKFERKDVELELADKIIVASQFTADTLKLSEVRNKETILIPYGSPEPLAKVNLKRNKKLKVLFVGGLSQRKGLSYLFDAANLLKDKIELTVIGRRISDCSILDKNLQLFRYISNLPHSEILKEMDQHDVLVFPSLFEGFGLVILEAMSRGVPVIASTNTAGPDIISDGEEGYIVPIRSAQIIAEKLEYLSNNPDTLDKMKIAALEKSKAYTWASYQYQLASLL